MILYQILMALALPFVLAHQALRGAPGAVAERLGLRPLPPPGPGPRLWLHGASVGELTSARWVVQALRQARPDLQLLITANSATGRALVAGWQMPGVTAALAPLDSAVAAARVMDHWQPQALISLENELWPARIAAAHRRGIPVLVIGARLSARSARRWARLPGLIGATLARIDWLSPQDEASAGRYVALGLPPAALGPVVALKAQPQTLVPRPPPFAAPFPRAATLLAASTHDGEEALIVQAFAKARAKGGPRHLILAPRHPQRGDAVAALLQAQPLPFVRRSKGQLPGPDTAIHLADTLGEMDHWYAMAGITLIGGTFANKGGHTPWEPAAAGSALLFGPSTHNFGPAFAALAAAHAALAVTSETLADTLASTNAPVQARLAAAAPAALAPFAEGSLALITRILRDLPQHIAD